MVSSLSRHRLLLVLVVLSLVSLEYSVCALTLRESFCCHLARRLSTTTLSPLSLTKLDFAAITEEIRAKTGEEEYVAEKSGGGFGAGGSGASVGSVKDGRGKSHKEYFYKSTGIYGYTMFAGEFAGLLEMFRTKTIKVPEPIAVIDTGDSAILIMEKLSLGGSGSSAEMGRQLAQMHRHTSPDGQFGFQLTNTIGATVQPNRWAPSWPDFWIENRLGHMLSLLEGQGCSFPAADDVKQKVRVVLGEHTSVVPSLIHGDLWSGNQGFTREGKPVIFDPACYFGDRECDLAMTRLFGSNSQAFYEAYEAEFPLPSGWQQRQVIYNLYHILNHCVLFGSGYQQQASSMMAKILSFP